MQTDHLAEIFAAVVALEQLRTALIVDSDTYAQPNSPPRPPIKPQQPDYSRSWINYELYDFICGFSGKPPGNSLATLIDAARKGLADLDRGDRPGAVHRFRFVASELGGAIDRRFALATLSRREKPARRSVTGESRLVQSLIAFALLDSDLHD